MKKKKSKQRNFVQMHVMEFNTPKVFVDRKKEMKRGYSKHRISLAEAKKDFYRSKNPFFISMPLL